MTFSLSPSAAFTSTSYFNPHSSVENWHTNPWHNFDEHLNVDGLAGIAPMDALDVINEINARLVSDVFTGRLYEPPVIRAASLYLDVNDDGFATAIDALLVINYLNTVAAQQEGEAAETDVSQVAVLESTSLAEPSTANYIVADGTGNSADAGTKASSPEVDPKSWTGGGEVLS